MIQVQRQDFNGRMLTIRRDDLRAIACILDTTVDGAAKRLDELRPLPGPLGPAPIVDAVTSASTCTSRSAGAAATTAPSRPGPTATHLVERYLRGLPHPRRAGGRRTCPPVTRCSSAAARRRSSTRPRCSRCSTRCPIAPGAEVTVECNPDDVTLDLAARPTATAASPASRSACSRWCPHVLAALGRTHDPGVGPHRGRRPRRASTSTSTSTSSTAGAGETVGRLGAHASTRRSPSAPTTSAPTPSPSSRARRWPPTPPATPTTTTRPTSTIVADERLERGRLRLVRDLELGPARPRVPAQPPLLVAGRVPRASAARPTRHRAGRRCWNVRTPERYIDAVEQGRSTEAADEGLDPDGRRLEGLQLGAAHRRRRARPTPSTTPSLERLDGLVEVDGDRARAHPRRPPARQRGRRPPPLTRLVLRAAVCLGDGRTRRGFRDRPLVEEWDTDLRSGDPLGFPGYAERAEGRAGGVGARPAAPSTTCSSRAASTCSAARWAWSHGERVSPGLRPGHRARPAGRVRDPQRRGPHAGGDGRRSSSSAGPPPRPAATPTPGCCRSRCTARPPPAACSRPTARCATCGRSRPAR